MQHEPCCLLSYAKVAGDLARANAVLAIADQPNRGEPFIESNRRILEDGSDFGAELTLIDMTGLTRPDAPRFEQRNILASARRTGDLAVWPAHRNRRTHAIVGIRKKADRFVKRSRYVRVHALNIAQEAQ